MIYGYIRVSTDKQTTENQRFEITGFAAKNRLKVHCWIMETISATKELDKRKLGKLLKKLKEGDVLVASELSRLGRNLLQVMSILHYCMSVGVQVWTIKDNYRLGADIQSKVLAFAFSLSAEIERNLISQRTKEALHRIRATGRKLGREFGSQNKKHILDGKEQEVINLLRKGVPKTQIAKILGVSITTIYNFLKRK